MLVDHQGNILIIDGNMQRMRDRTIECCAAALLAAGNRAISDEWFVECSSCG